jgi:hypothetical protein
MLIFILLAAIVGAASANLTPSEIRHIFQLCKLECHVSKKKKIKFLLLTQILFRRIRSANVNVGNVIP